MKLINCFSKKYANLVIQKLIRTLVSVKVWVMVATFYLAFYIIGIAAENKAWELVNIACNMVITIIGVVLAMRSAFYEGSLSESDDKPDDKPKEE